MSIDLIILGMLIEKPQSAYALQKEVENHHFDRWSKISIPSIYKKVLQLEGKGYLERTLMQGDKLSNKAVYSITKAGKIYFNQLMEKMSLTNPLVIFDFNILISNITKVSFDQGIILIQNLKKKLLEMFQASKGWEETFSEIPFNGKAIIKQQISVYQTLIEWLTTFEKEYIHTNSENKNEKY